MFSSLFAPEIQAIFDNAFANAGLQNGPYPSPAEWRDVPIYFLLVDRFNNPHKQPATKTSYFDPKFNGYQGGSFSGIKAQLNYIKNLGFGAIWLSPVLKNLGTYHGYGIHDFLRAEPSFADKAETADDELRSLVDAAHQAGLYVIFDIVLNHTGNVFAYDGQAKHAFSDKPLPIQWRDDKGVAQPSEPVIEDILVRSVNALVWPAELQKNAFFRCQGVTQGDSTIGDFNSLKQFRTDLADVQNHLIRAYQYIIARYDIDGFRIDTLRYLQGNFSRSFGNAIREFALSIGKKNFFTFGEVLDGSSEQDIARFIGKNTLATNDPNSMVGVDAALDYPLFYALLPVVKAQLPPSSVIKMYEFRKQQEQFILSSHGDASRYFVTFLDNHDSKERIRFVDKNTDIDHYVYTDPAIPAPHDDQVTLALASLFCLPGIPCVYYGTEQGFHGSATAFGLTQPPDEPVREALWGYDPKFSQNSRFYQEILKIAKLRAATPALRYGRYYFRPISADGKNFAISTNPGGVLAWSRILNDKEVLIVSNTHSQQNNTLFVILDSNLSQVSDKITVLYSNKTKPAPPASITHLANVNITQTDASQGVGSINVTQISLQPMEIQVLQVERMF